MSICRRSFGRAETGSGPPQEPHILPQHTEVKCQSGTQFRSCTGGIFSLLSDVLLPPLGRWRAWPRTDFTPWGTVWPPTPSSRTLPTVLEVADPGAGHSSLVFNGRHRLQVAVRVSLPYPCRRPDLPTDFIMFSGPRDPGYQALLIWPDLELGGL